MANTNRRYLDRNGYQFMPMNVQGSYTETRFMTTVKWITLACIIASAGLIYFILFEKGRPINYILFYGLWAFISSLLIRFVIFEETFYYKMYLKLKDSQITTPAEFWNISSINDTDEGAILTFSDGRVGVVLKVDRDTITGKTEDFRETHYDAISDFYREITNLKYSFVQMNIMEQAGNDPRLSEMSKLVYKDSNPNICKLIEEQFGHIKNITHKTLYESDYFLIYTTDLSKVDMIISDAIDCVYKLLDGAYIGYNFLSQIELVELIKEYYNVSYFDAVEATLVMSKNNGYNMKNPFTITEVWFTDGKTQKVTNKELYKINQITSEILNGTKDSDSVSIKDAILSKENKKDFNVDFNSISQGFNTEQKKAGNNTRSSAKKTKIPKQLNKNNIQEKNKVNTKTTKNKQVNSHVNLDKNKNEQENKNLLNMDISDFNEFQSGSNDNDYLDI